MVEAPKFVFQKPVNRHELAGSVGNNRPSALGARYLQSSDPLDMRDAKAGAPARRLAGYLASEGAWDIGVERFRSLSRVQGILESYIADGHMPEPARLVTLDVANQNVKAMLGTAWKNIHVRTGLSSSGDYAISTALLAVADALSYYVAPDGDKVKVHFTQGPNGESQIKVGGHALLPMPTEVKNAIAALLELSGAELLPNGASHAISMKDGTCANMHYEHPE